MSKIAALTEKRATLIRGATELRNSITDVMTPAEITEINTRFDAAMAAADNLAEEIARENRLAAAERSLSDPRETRRGGREDRGASAGADRAAEYRSAFLSYLRGADLSREDRGLLRNGYVAEPETRAQSVGADTAGGYTVPQEFQAELVRTLRAFGPMYDGGIVREIITEGGGSMPWPTVNDTANVGVAIAENAAATGEGDVTFGQRVLSAYKFGSGPIRVSNELIDDSAIDIESLLGELMGERIGRIVNTKLTLGSGTGEPQGIVTGAGLGKTTASATAITADELIDFYHSINRAYRAAPKFRFMFADTTLSAIRKLKDGQGRYLIENLGDNAAALSLAGFRVPYSVNDDVPAIATGARAIVGGDFSKYVVRKVRSFAVLRVDQVYAFNYQVAFLGFTRIDGGVMDTSAIKALALA